MTMNSTEWRRKPSQRLVERPQLCLLRPQESFHLKLSVCVEPSRLWGFGPTKFLQGFQLPVYLLVTPSKYWNRKNDHQRHSARFQAPRQTFGTYHLPLLGQARFAFRKLAGAPLWHSTESTFTKTRKNPQTAPKRFSINWVSMKRVLLGQVVNRTRRSLAVSYLVGLFYPS